MNQKEIADNDRGELTLETIRQLNRQLRCLPDHYDHIRQNKEITFDTPRRHGSQIIETEVVTNINNLEVGERVIYLSQGNPTPDIDTVSSINDDDVELSLPDGELLLSNEDGSWEIIEFHTGVDVRDAGYSAILLRVTDQCFIQN